MKKNKLIDTSSVTDSFGIGAAATLLGLNVVMVRELTRLGYIPVTQLPGHYARYTHEGIEPMRRMLDKYRKERGM